MSAHLPRALAHRLDSLAWRAHAFHRYAHHPLCREYRGELVALGQRTRLCRGCTLVCAGSAFGLVAGALGHVAPSIWLASGVTAMGVFFLTPLRRASKVLTRFLPAGLLAATVAGGVGLRSVPGLVEASIAILVLILAGVVYRRRGPNRAPCETCPERSLQPECRGLRPIMQRERAYQRLANRLIARSVAGS